ncbi:MAG: glycosyltransferase family 39 protein [Candidatus Microgenomates bacterium]|jgi:4-amino-4-deoxy-L-arabinose transferase-like glycosyltransferase
MFNQLFLNFSDAAKFADIAKNLINGLGYGGNFSFWGPSIFDLIKARIFSYPGTPPVMPYSIATFFKIFGVTDFAVIATSFFYFILTLIFVFLLGKRIFKSNLVGALSTLAVGLNYDMINYATSGASESPFIFEIVASSYFASIKKKWASAVTILFLVLMYLTRPQAFIYIVGIMLFWLLNNFKTKKALISFVGIMIIGLLFDHFVLEPLSGKYFLYSIIGRGLGSSFNQSGVASDALRGAVWTTEGISQTIKNIFYNLYNFFKLMPQIMSPYLFGIFVIGLFMWGKDKLQNSFKAAGLFMVLVTFLVTAASIPFFRYIHPVVPLIYIIAVGTLIEIVGSKISNKKLLILAFTLLILLFGVGQTLGVLLLDSRFEASTHNVGKPPEYVLLSQILKDNTSSDQTVITNLDTWGSWYGNRKTVWFPLEPKQLIDPATRKIPFDAIYLTSYLIDDPNYYMGTDWRMIFDNPGSPAKWTCDGCGEISKEFVLKVIYKVPAVGDYENQDAESFLFVKK